MTTTEHRAEPPVLDLDAIRARHDAPHDPVACGKECWTLAHQDAPALLAEIERLQALADHPEQAALAAIAQRDEREDLLDKFAYKVAPVQVIGEHSHANDPWANALDMLAPAAAVDQARADERRLCVAELRRHSSERMTAAVGQVASGDDNGFAGLSYASTMERAARLLESGELAGAEGSAR